MLGPVTGGVQLGAGGLRAGEQCRGQGAQDGGSELGVGVLGGGSQEIKFGIPTWGIGCCKCDYGAVLLVE